MDALSAQVGVRVALSTKNHGNCFQGVLGNNELGETDHIF